MASTLSCLGLDGCSWITRFISFIIGSLLYSSSGEVATGACDFPSRLPFPRFIPFLLIYYFIYPVFELFLANVFIP